MTCAGGGDRQLLLPMSSELSPKILDGELGPPGGRSTPTNPPQQTQDHLENLGRRCLAENPSTVPT
jgi:hypothetical protein